MDRCGIWEIDHALKKRIHQERCLVCRSYRRCDRVNRGTLPCFQPVWLLDVHRPCASLQIEAALGLTPGDAVCDSATALSPSFDDQDDDTE